MAAAVRKGLTQARILETARALVDAGGPPALTMRALASELGVASMAVYNHFHDRDAILDAIANEVFEHLRATAEKAGRTRKSGVAPWRKAIRHVMMSAQDVALEHPHIFRLALTRPQKPAAAFALTAQSLEALRKAGLNETQSLTAYHSFVILLQGYPFWREGCEQAESDAATELFMPRGWTAKRQFAAVVDWLLDCVAAMAAQGATVNRRTSGRLRPGAISPR